MILRIHSGASSLSYLSSLAAEQEGASSYKIIEKNGAVHTVSNIIKIEMVSSVEAKIGSLFHNYQKAEPIRTTLHKIVHIQTTTPMQTEKKSTAIELQIIQCSKNYQK